jgi:hypothetical protein
VIRVPSFVVIGGAHDGAFYVRQLLRAVAAGRLETERILVIDRDPGCSVAQQLGERVELVVEGWDRWLDRALEHCDPADRLVPYHWAPHLLVGWLARQAERAGAAVALGGELAPQGLPLERPTRDGDLALSYATWLCPPTCIEPTLCPHTRGPKDWSLAAELERARVGEAIDDRIVFRSLHLAYGVATIPITDILSARARLLGGLRLGTRRYLVATASHCHGLATRLEVTPARRT